MWFVYFYVISVVVCFLVLEILARAMINKLKREGIADKLKKKTFSEKVASSLPAFIPFFNIIIVLIAVLWQEEVYKRVKFRLQEEEDEERRKEDVDINN